MLVNDAGTMMNPEGLTADGYEIQFRTDVLGLALLTQVLLPTLRWTAEVNNQARVVTVSSASISQAPSNAYNLDELSTSMDDRGTIQGYTILKLADLHYAKALAEREIAVKIIPIHSELVATILHHASTGLFLKLFLYVAIRILATPVQKGALSQVYAATCADARSGRCYSPIGKWVRIRTHSKP